MDLEGDRPRHLKLFLSRLAFLSMEGLRKFLRQLMLATIFLSFYSIFYYHIIAITFCHSTTRIDVCVGSWVTFSHFSTDNDDDFYDAF